MISSIVAHCHERYIHSRCISCSYQEHCPHDCAKCLHYIHTPTAAPAPREYDCGHMADFYVCKYAHKYTSEMYCALMQAQDAKNKSHLRVLSIGCGPCTDLLALNLLQQEKIYEFSSVEYRGIELDTSIWENILTDIGTICPLGYDICIANADVCMYIDTLMEDDWRPDIIILQYVFSDMQKKCDTNTIEAFVACLAHYFDTCDQNTYIICNDINLSTTFNGGREYFDLLFRKIASRKQCRTLHFKNSNKANHYEYGEEYRTNELICIPPEYLNRYDPYLSCASAQIIIKKVKV